MTARRKLYATVAILGLGGVACFLAASFESAQSGPMAAIDSAEASEQASFALQLYAVGILNVGAGIVFILRSSRLTWWLLIVLQAAVFLWAVVEGAMTDIGWFAFSALPLFSLLMLLAFRYADARLRPVFPMLAAIPAVVMVAFSAHVASAQPPSVSVTSHPTPLPAGLALTCTDNLLSYRAMGPLADGNHVHYICDYGKVRAWWIDRNAGIENAPPA